MTMIIVLNANYNYYNNMSSAIDNFIVFIYWIILYNDVN